MKTDLSYVRLLAAATAWRRQGHRSRWSTRESLDLVDLVDQLTQGSEVSLAHAVSLEGRLHDEREKVIRLVVEARRERRKSRLEDGPDFYSAVVDIHETRLRSIAAELGRLNEATQPTRTHEVKPRRRFDRGPVDKGAVNWEPTTVGGQGPTRTHEVKTNVTVAEWFNANTGRLDYFQFSPGDVSGVTKAFEYLPGRPIRFAHGTPVLDDGTKQKPFTIAYQRHLSEVVFSVAYCHPQDDFDRSCGEKVASDRLIYTGGTLIRLARPSESVVHAVCQVLGSVAQLKAHGVSVGAGISPPAVYRSFVATPEHEYMTVQALAVPHEASMCGRVAATECEYITGSCTLEAGHPGPCFSAIF